jgi:hypothetical protein
MGGLRSLLAAVPLLAAAFAACSAWAQPGPDFTSHAGLERSCRQLAAVPAARLQRDADKVGFAICSGVELLRAGAHTLREQKTGRLDERGVVERVRALLEDSLARIRTARAVLETVKGRGPYLRIEPGKWMIDLDGDGIITPLERYFFWVPKRGTTLLPESAPSDEYYRARYTPPVIRVDRSDLYWALAYCHFAEAALHLALSYDVDLAGGPLRVQLRDAERVRGVAYPALMQGLQYSRKLRDSLARETDDDAEWIPGPQQANTAFPLVMDAQTFATWGELLGHLDLLAAGKTLLGGKAGARDLSSGVCGPGEGFNLRQLLLDPVRQPLDQAQWRARCVEAGARLPLTGLARLIEASLARNAGRNPESVSGEWMILRHLYWVN